MTYIRTQAHRGSSQAAQADEQPLTMDGVVLTDAERPAVGGAISYDVGDGVGSFYGSKNWQDIEAKRRLDQARRLRALGLPVPAAVVRRPLLPPAAVPVVAALTPWSRGTAYGNWAVGSRTAPTAYGGWGVGDLGAGFSFKEWLAKQKALLQARAKRKKAKRSSKAVTVSNRFTYAGATFALDAATATWRMVSAPKAMAENPSLKREFATSAEARAAVDAVSGVGPAAPAPAAPEEVHTLTTPVTPVTSVTSVTPSAPTATVTDYKGFTLSPRLAGTATKWYVTGNANQVRVVRAFAAGPYDSTAAAQTAIDLSTQAFAPIPYAQPQYPRSMPSAASMVDPGYGSAADSSYGDDAAASESDDYGGGSSAAYSDDGYGAAEGDDATYNEGGAYGMGDLGFGFSMPNIGGKLSRIAGKVSRGVSQKLSSGMKKAQTAMSAPDQVVQEEDTFIPGETLPGSSTPWIIGGSILGVAVVGTVIAIMVSRRKKK